MEKTMPSGTFRLKARHLRELTEQAGRENPHQVSMLSGVSYPTIEKYVVGKTPVEDLVHMPSLAGILIDACGMAPEKVLAMRMGELFEYVPNERAKAGR